MSERQTPPADLIARAADACLAAYLQLIEDWPSGDPCPDPSDEQLRLAFEGALTCVIPGRQVPPADLREQVLQAVGDALADLADLHHKTLTGSRKHNPARIASFNDCDCLSCKRASAALSKLDALLAERQAPPADRRCPRCHGSGIEPSKQHTTRAPCWECGGGRVRQAPPADRCPTCGHTGPDEITSTEDGWEASCGDDWHDGQTPPADLREQVKRALMDASNRQGGYDAVADAVMGVFAERERLLADVIEYAQHDSWRCEYRERYKTCRCGLDDLMARLGLPPVAVNDPEANA